MAGSLIALRRQEGQCGDTDDDTGRFCSDREILRRPYVFRLSVDQPGYQRNLRFRQLVDQLMKLIAQEGRTSAARW